MEEAPGLEPGVRVLQTLALPLGDASMLSESVDYTQVYVFLKGVFRV